MIQFRAGVHPWWRFCVMWTHIAIEMKDARIREDVNYWFTIPLRRICQGIPCGADGLHSACRLEPHYPKPCEPRVPEWAGVEA